MKLLAGVTLFSILIGCGRGENETTSKVQRAVIPGGVDSSLELGQAYDKDTAEWGNVACVQGEQVSIGGDRATVNYSNDMSYEQRLKSMNGVLSVDVPFPSVKVSASADYAADTAATEFRETLILRAEAFTTSKLKLGTVQLSNAGSKFGALNQLKMRSTCKNEFVNEIHYGALLDAVMTIEYQTKKDKERFGGSLKIDVLGGAVKVEGKLALASEEEKQSVKVVIKATQVGGNAKSMFEALSADTVKCSAQSIQSCINTFGKLIAQANALQTQLDSPAKFKPIAYLTESYEASGISELVPNDSPIVAAATASARETLEAELKKTRFSASRIEFLRTLELGLGLNSEETTKIENAFVAVENNKSLLQNALFSCYQSPYTIFKKDMNGNDIEVNSCDNAKKFAINNVQRIDPAVFEVGKKPREDRKCQKARASALEDSEIDSLQFLSFENANFAPVYRVIRQPSSGIAGWTNCAKISDKI